MENMMDQCLERFSATGECVATYPKEVKVSRVMDYSTHWSSGELWIGQLVGVMNLGLLIYLAFVTIVKERDFPGQEET
jgi:hypothetical protein